MTAPNAAQAEAWSGDMGRRWVALDDDLSAQMTEVAAVLLDRAALRPGERILDIGCGSGHLSRRAAEAVGPDGGVLGLDLSGPLLDLAEARNPGTVQVAKADAQVFDFGSRRFDVALSRFGVMFFDDPAAAFGNIRKAMIRGGRLVMACWADAAANPWFSDPKAAAEARLGAMPPSDPDAPGPLAFRDPARVLPILDSAGFDDGAAETVDLELHQPDGWAAMERMLPAIGPIPGVMREKDGTDADLRAILDRLHAAWAPHISTDGIRLPARILIYTARATAKEDRAERP